MTSPQTPAAETVRIAGVGFAVPNNVRANSEILKAFPNRTEDEIVRLTGIKERRYADDDESATSLAAIAVEHALIQAGLPVSEIDTIIMATIIPDQPVPVGLRSRSQRSWGSPGSEVSLRGVEGYFLRHVCHFERRRICRR